MRARFVRTVLLPLFVMLAFMMIVGFFGLEWARQRVDDAAVAQQEKTLQVEISNRQRDLAIQLGSVARWLPLAQKLHEVPLDRTWLWENVGTWLYEMFDHDDVYIVDMTGALIYGAVSGREADGAEFGKVSSAIAPVVASFQPTSSSGTSSSTSGTSTVFGRDTSPGVSAAPEEDFTNDGPRGSQRVRLMLLDDRPAIVTARSVVSARSSSQSLDSAFVAISVAYFHAAYLEHLAKHVGLDALRYSRSPSALGSERSMALHATDGSDVGYLLWTPVLPGTQMARVIGPVGIGTFILVILVSAYMARAIWLSALLLSRSIIELQASEAQAQHLAYHDVLTGLPNRALLNERIIQALGHAGHAGQGEQMAILMLDLDRFKHVNDTLGHHAGDLLIKEVAQRLQLLAGPSDTVARLGGDEFVIVQSAVRDRADVNAFCKRIVEVVSDPFELNGNNVHVSVSIGVVTAPLNGMEPGELMRKADIALYAAKAEGRDRHTYFESFMDDRVRVQRAIGVDLRSAVKSGQGLAVHYQPLIDARSQKIIGLEALLRWQHATRGAISPGEFIPVAEETGIILPLGEWVLREACRTAKRWPDIFVAVNLSPVQFRSADFASRMIDIVAQENCAASSIEFEITEGMLLSEDEASKAALEALRAAGFRIALDDFGTGYSSLSYLRRFKVDKIKIDQSFIQNLGGHEDTSAIIESVITLGRAMGLTVVAEGVETSDQKDTLVAAGCHELQGYLFSRAVSELDLEQLMALSEPNADSSLTEQAPR
ncbi:bifunctional diguanylate cyclase/phosphodiesterase [Schauerella aestuarii]|uniref:bifunctional diguanylate cyclase/phosphodiesterase n=1 Tax=Schauerella aestuarii TaxID=2511204 RepID=UPI00136B531A|nr:EAL domain-containing protein [Achromobacter aestuarii]